MSAQEARYALQELEAQIDIPKVIIAHRDHTSDYDMGRLIKQIMGLQMVILRNGGDLSFSRLPQFWKEPKQ